ncbi:hypothetical protein HYC85_013575 [Camellia sinensis]|uniref:HECT-type E3 ubiquitin transferase n=1 Tax=Camellia sinensis TaxID=4442 RepID=A0A7J7H7B1_CAMSI|nr:hypothetical protein HYC85_013575 [Camellia sinensis]
MFTTMSRSTTIYSTIAELHMDDFRRVSGCAQLSYVGMVRLSTLRLRDVDGGVAEDNGRRRRWQFKFEIDEREREKIESLFSLYQCMSFFYECSQIRVTFVNGFGVVEAGIDGDGIFKDFMENITQAAFNVQYGLFKTLKFDAKFEGNLMLIELGFFVEGSAKGASTMVAYPRALLSIAVSVCGLAFFLILASLLLVTQPIGSTVRGYFYGVDNLRQFDSMSWSNKTIHDSFNDGTEDLRKWVSGLNETASNSRHNDDRIDDSSTKSDSSMSGNGQSPTVVGSGSAMDKNRTSKSDGTNDVSNLQQGSSGPSIVPETEKSVDQQGQEATENPTSSNVAKGVENAKPASLGLVNSSNIIQPGLAVPSSSPASGDISKSGLVDSGTTKYSLSFM